MTALLVDQNLLDYNEKVSKYWPEFGQNGKDDITVADVLRHESGLAWLNCTLQKHDAHRSNIHKNVVGSILEKEQAHFPQFAGPNKVPTKREYHSLTRGLILNEIVRRVDPKGRTIGEILAEVKSGQFNSQLLLLLCLFPEHEKLFTTCF